MSNNNFTDIGLIDILSNLQWATNIKELYFGNNENLTEVGMSALIEVLPVFKNLKILGLNNCGLNDENIILFSYCLEVHIFPPFFLFFKGFAQFGNNVSEQ